MSNAQLRIDSVSPRAGSYLGGNRIEISGEGFVPGAVVRFGDAVATRVEVAEDGRSIVCYSPPGSPGRRNVGVALPSGHGAGIQGGFEFT